MAQEWQSHPGAQALLDLMASRALLSRLEALGRLRPLPNRGRRLILSPCRHAATLALGQGLCGCRLYHHNIIFEVTVCEPLVPAVIPGARLHCLCWAKHIGKIVSKDMCSVYLDDEDGVRGIGVRCASGVVFPYVVVDHLSPRMPS